MRISNRLRICRIKMVGQALEELLVEAYHQNCLRIGVIESYKYMKALVFSFLRLNIVQMQ